MQAVKDYAPATKRNNHHSRFESFPSANAARHASDTTTSGVAAQENLVPNPSFELISEDTEVKDIKKFGLVNEHVLEWSGVNDVSPDLFVVREKASKVSVPCNDYGFEQAKDGEYYAGFRAYSKSSKLKRSYLQVQLTEMLEENQVYMSPSN